MKPGLSDSCLCSQRLNAYIHFPVIHMTETIYFMIKLVRAIGSSLIWFYLLDICFLVVPKQT